MNISWRWRLLLVGTMTVLSAGTPFCRAQQLSAVLIEKALDDPAKISFHNISLEDAFENLRKDLGIPFKIDPPALAQLPYGQLTMLSSVQLQGMSWRDALRELLKPLALTFQPGADSIHVFGTDELMRQPRRLNIAELDAIVRLQNTNLTSRDKNLFRQIQLYTRIDFKLIELDHHLEKADEESTEKALSSFPRPAAKVLDLYSRRVLTSKYKLDNESGTWYVRADVQGGRAAAFEIIILPARNLNQLKLDRRVNFPFKNQPIQTTLQELAQEGAIGIRFEPGCFGLVDENLRNNFSLSMRSATIKDALEAISGMTGLAHEVRDDSVYISAGEPLKRLDAERKREAAQGANPLACVIIVRLPGTSFETMMFIREEELKNAGVLEKYRQFQQKSTADFIRFLRDKGPDGTGVKK